MPFFKYAPIYIRYEQYDIKILLNTYKRSIKFYCRNF